MKVLLPLSFLCLCLGLALAPPTRAEEEAGPVGATRPQADSVIAARAGDMDGDRPTSGCRVAKTVEMGIAFGGGQVRRQVGARLDYGQDVAGMPAGVALPPCPANGLALSLAVSSSDGGFGRDSQAIGQAIGTTIGTPGEGAPPLRARGPGRAPDGGRSAR